MIINPSLPLSWILKSNISSEDPQGLDPLGGTIELLIDPP
jgi:hypothetical protein